MLAKVFYGIYAIHVFPFQTGNYLLFLGEENIAMVTEMLRADPVWDEPLQQVLSYARHNFSNNGFCSSCHIKYLLSLFHMTEMTTIVKLVKAVMTRQDL